MLGQPARVDDRLQVDADDRLIWGRWSFACRMQIVEIEPSHDTRIGENKVQAALSVPDLLENYGESVVISDIRSVEFCCRKILVRLFAAFSVEVEKMYVPTPPNGTGILQLRDPCPRRPL